MLNFKIILMSLILVLGAGTLAYVVAQGTYPEDAIFTPEFNFVLSEGEKTALLTGYSNILYDILEDGAYTQFVLNGTAMENRPDLSIKLEDYVQSQRPVYNSTGSKFDCNPELVQGIYILRCYPI